MSSHMDCRPLLRSGLTPCSLTNAKASAIYRLRPHLPADAPLPPTGTSAPANLGIEIAPQAQLESLLAALEGGDKGKGKEVAGKVDVGKVAEKVVKNVSLGAPEDPCHDIGKTDGQLFNYLHSFGGDVKLT